MTLTNIVFVQNTASVRGGAVGADSSTDAGVGKAFVNIVSASFLNNTAPFGDVLSGDGISLVDGVIWGSPSPFDPSGAGTSQTPIVTYTAAPGVQRHPRDIVLTLNPFDAPVPVLGTNDKLYLAAGSPPIDAGTTAGAPADWTQRTTLVSKAIDTAPIDMGAHYEIAPNAQAP